MDKTDKVDDKKMYASKAKMGQVLKDKTETLYF